MWAKETIEKHVRAAELLGQVKDEIFDYLKQHRAASEYAAAQFIEKRYRHYGLRSDREQAIVAFRCNTSQVHYYPEQATAKRLKPESLIMLDIWAALDEPEAPFADITWMAYAGQTVTVEMLEILELVFKARDAAVQMLRDSLSQSILPTGQALDQAARSVIAAAGQGERFLHTTGHSLGFVSPHGEPAGLNLRNDQPLQTNLGYTIEPGVYLDGKFGVRSEIDFYINEALELVITSEVQQELVRL